jgi:hypothetical protein
MLVSETSVVLKAFIDVNEKLVMAANMAANTS